MSIVSVSEGNEVVLSGACLGLGLVCMQTEDVVVYDALKKILYKDSAVTGEAAGFVQSTLVSSVV